MGSLVFNPATWIFIAAVVTLHNSQVRREKAAEREKRPKPLRWEDRLLAREQEE